MEIDDKNQEILDEIDRWQQKKAKANFIFDLAEYVLNPVDRLFGLLISEKSIVKNSAKIEKVLKKFQDSSQLLVNCDDIVNIAAIAGLPVQKIEDFKRMPVEYLDVLSKSFLKKSSIYAALQGAGLSTGSFALIFVDLSTLFLVNITMILQIGACYGFDPTTLSEKDFALHIFYLASSSGRERNEEVKEIVSLMDDLGKGVFNKASSVLSSDQGIKGFINHAIIKFVKKGITRKFPIISVPLGAGYNYLYTREVALHACMFYRKRFVQNNT